MLALLLATESSGDLAALTAGGPTALLPILDRPLLLHAIDGLVGAGIRRLLVAVTDEDRAAVQRELAPHAAGGLSFELVGGVRGESHLDAAARLARDVPELLVARAEVMRSPFLGRFLAMASARPGVNLAATAAGTDARLWRLCPGSQPLRTVEHANARAGLIDTVADLHRVTLEALAGRFGGLPGRTEQQSGHAGGTTWTGRRAHIGRGVRMEGDVVLGADTVVGPGAVLRNAVVLPGTHVGADVELHDAVAAGNMLARIDTGVVVQVTDADLLGHRRPARTAGRLIALVHRTVSTVLSSPRQPSRRVSTSLTQTADRRGEPHPNPPSLR